MPQLPFPGMDPYLEAPDIWPDVHANLISVFREQLAPLLAPKYIAELQTQIVIDLWDEPQSAAMGALPDVSIIQPGAQAGVTVASSPAAVAPLRLRVPIAVPTRLTSIYIRHRERERVVAIIELLSPINKHPGKERRSYVKKRQAIFESPTHFVEIDLLRKGTRMPLDDPLPLCDYLAIVANTYERPNCDVWPLSVRQPLPTIPIPLIRPDPDVPLDIGLALRTAYERARYDLRIDYHKPPTPPLSPDDAEWASQLIAEATKRVS